MRLFDLLNLSLRMFKTRKSRTFFTVLGMGIGTGAVLFLIGLGYGIQNLLLARIVSSDTLLSLTISSAQPDVIILDNQTIADIYKIEGVEDIAPTVTYSAQMSLGNLVGNVVLRGVDSGYFKYEGISAIQGRLSEERKKEILISEAVVQLFEVEDIVGREVNINAFIPIEDEETGEELSKTIEFKDKYTIVGVVEGLESVLILFPLKDIKDKTDIIEYEMAKVKVFDKGKMDDVKEELINKGFQVTSLSETIDQANKIFSGIQIALGFFGAIALFVAAIGMVNTMTVTLLERTQEIGIMRATGASKKDILSLFVAESTIMGFLGGVSGLVIGVLGGKLFNLGINLLASAFGGQVVSLFFYPLWFILALILVSTFVGLLAGFFPGRRAAKLDPLEALRYK